MKKSQFMISAAEHVEDVERDPVVIVDGLTKNWRYPGWRISWTLGPKAVIEAIASAGSFLDGGANHPFQNAALLAFENVVTDLLHFFPDVPELALFEREEMLHDAAQKCK